MKTLNTFKQLLSCFCMIGLLFVLTNTVSAQTLTSDQSDYAPGTTATLIGSGFAGGETVTVQVVHGDGSSSSGEDHDPWDVTANGNGNFVTTWHVCEDDCVGALLLATADGNSSGSHAETLFTDANNGTGVVTVTADGGSCLDFTAANGGGPDSWEVIEGGSYTMTITGVTECSGDAITVFVQNSQNGNFCFTATGGSGTYVGSFTMPDPSCFTSPISYKCGADQPCNNSDTWSAQGPSGASSVHLRASTFDGDCNRTGDDTICACCTAPQLAGCPEDGGYECFADVPDPAVVTATDCEGNEVPVDYSEDQSNPGSSCDNTITRTWTATNDCGTSSCTQIINVNDVTSPELSGCPEDASYQCYADVPPPAEVTATDNCDPDVPVDYNEEQSNPGSSCHNTISRTWSAQDDCGNPISCTQTIEVNDDTSPELSGCPEDASYQCYADVPPPAEVTATDNCDSDVPVDYNEEQSNPGSNCHNTITRTWTAEDDCGNPVSCTQTITVNDTTDPSITCPAEVTACEGEEVILGEPTASDNCDQDLEVTNDAPPTFEVGTTIVTWTAKDDCGNIATCEQTVIITGDCCVGFRTETQGGWGAIPNGHNNGVYVHANFDGAFPGGVTIGCVGATLSLTSAQAVTDFLPSTTTPAVLPAGALVDPGSSYHNVLAGQLMTLALTLGFDLYDPDFSANAIHLEDLFIASGPFAGLTVGEFFAIANDVIGGCSNAYTPALINEVLDSINNNYDDGKVDLGYLTCTPPCECEPPTNITVTPIGNDQILVCWDAKRCARGYTVQYQWKGHANWITIDVGDSVHCVVIDLKGHVYVTIRVSTTCADGSITDYATNVVYRYSDPCLVPTQMSTTNITSTSATFNWTPGTVTTSQKVRYQVVGQATSVVKSVGKTSTSYIATGLTPSTTYKWKVKGDCWSPYLKFKTAALKSDGLTTTQESIIDLALYPNPADNYVTVSFTTTADENASFDIYNATGVRMVHMGSREFASGQSAQVEFDVSSLAAGIYFLHVNTNDQVVIRKFVVTR